MNPLQFNYSIFRKSNMEFNPRNPLIIYIWMNVIFFAPCHGNVTFKDKPSLLITNKTKVESSSLYVWGPYSGDANKTIDRNFNQSYVDCMHTAPGQSEAWLKIDLGRVFNLKSVRIWYRNDRGAYSTRRLSGFSILVSNNSEWNINNTCYQDSGNVTLETVLDVNCSDTAQYVKIYANKDIDGGAILEICELEIYGCSYQDSVGNCISCDQCKNDCMINGECDEQGCKSDSLPPPFCKECREGFYGRNCSHVCGHCVKQVVCDQVNGSCPSGYCEPGWKYTPDKRCNEECDGGTYGLYCSTKCGYCAKGVSCNKVDGSCPGGCEDGWTNLYCNETCKKGLYGKNCTRTCGHCLDKATCNHVTGSCPFGICEPGWKHTLERRCNQECVGGTYGLYCSTKCGYCAKGVSCNKVDGSCPGGCEDGWTNLYCNEKCNKGLYGKNCARSCGHCLNNATCDHVTGSCTSGLCESGWKHTPEKRCNQGLVWDAKSALHFRMSEQINVFGACFISKICKMDNIYFNEWKLNKFSACRNGFYGRNCSFLCGQCANNAKCDHVTGSCPSGLCERGWKNTSDKRCNEECENGTFGLHCRSKCSGHCAGGLSCNKVNGSCPEGCGDGLIRTAMIHAKTVSME
ncbi:multiple epidermal growth factor-like domains protein 10 [Saccostrea cucullata]|uniref:multiple epidermal growth factor-like domains protein 10 n=1 Tax=Saccostrea cuccullata TaxID=36930 RepID=UPI002ED0EBC8